MAKRRIIIPRRTAAIVVDDDGQKRAAPTPEREAEIAEANRRRDEKATAKSKKFWAADAVAALADTPSPPKRPKGRKPVDAGDYENPDLALARAAEAAIPETTSVSAANLFNNPTALTPDNVRVARTAADMSVWEIHDAQLEAGRQVRSRDPERFGPSRDWPPPNSLHDFMRRRLQRMMQRYLIVQQPLEDETYSILESMVGSYRQLEDAYRSAINHYRERFDQGPREYMIVDMSDAEIIWSCMLMEEVDDRDLRAHTCMYRLEGQGGEHPYDVIPTRLKRMIRVTKAGT